MSNSDADQGSVAVPSRDSADTQVAPAPPKGEGYDLSRDSMDDFGFVYEGKLHIRTEFVSGLQVTFAHILAHPNPWILEDLQLGPFPDPEKVALGLVNCMPVELLPVIVDLMAKSSNVDIQIADRFMGHHHAHGHVLCGAQRHAVVYRLAGHPHLRHQPPRRDHHELSLGRQALCETAAAGCHVAHDGAAGRGFFLRCFL